MQDIEPFYNWREFYIAADDPRSPFFGTVYSEFEFTNTVYNYFIHPQWDEFGSNTLYLKVLYADYERGYAIMELIGEWNDALYNDIMFLKREVVEPMMQEGIDKFILVGENVLNFHGSDDCYYDEWFQEAADGWIATVNFRPHVLLEMSRFNLDYFFASGGELDEMNWRTHAPNDLFYKVDSILRRRLN
ncbi:MAG: hypothetical protein RL213_899 [Bacteroidota bacterium]|jgi:hypothetical protein